MNKTAAKEHETILKTKLLTGQMPSPRKVHAQEVTFRQWAAQYLALEPIKRLKGYALRACMWTTSFAFLGTSRLEPLHQRMWSSIEHSECGTSEGSVPHVTPSSCRPPVEDVDGSVRIRVFQCSHRRSITIT